jgi:hypothetical protein
MTNAVPTAVLAMTGQSIWVDNITRAMLGGQLQRYIAEWSVVGLTSNPTIFAKAIAGSKDYDGQVAELAAKGMGEEAIFFELALADLTRACDLFAGVHARTGGVDGWCSLEVSPLLAYDAKSTVEQAVELHARAARPNLYIKVPGTAAGVPAIGPAVEGEREDEDGARQREEEHRLGHRCTSAHTTARCSPSRLLSIRVPQSFCAASPTTAPNLRRPSSKRMPSRSTEGKLDGKSGKFAVTAPHPKCARCPSRLSPT